MPGIGVAAQSPKICHNPPAEGIQVKVPYQLEEVGFFLHHDGLISILEEVTHSTVATIERSRIARQQRAEASREGAAPSSNQQVSVIGQ
jgi:hypothetical protein